MRHFVQRLPVNEYFQEGKGIGKSILNRNRVRSSQLAKPTAHVEAGVCKIQTLLICLIRLGLMYFQSECSGELSSFEEEAG